MFQPKKIFDPKEKFQHKKIFEFDKILASKRFLALNNGFYLYIFLMKLNSAVKNSAIFWKRGKEILHNKHENIHTNK